MANYRRGFNRIGIALSAPFFALSVGMFLYAFYVRDGTYVPDEKQLVAGDVKISIDADLTAGEKSYRDRNWAALLLETSKEIKIKTGPTRTYTLNRLDVFRGKNESDKDISEEEAHEALRMLVSFERKRGSVITADEYPVSVGHIFIDELKKRTDEHRPWSHLKRGVSSSRIGYAIAVFALGAAVYLAFRTVGWIIGGFLS